MEEVTSDMKQDSNSEIKSETEPINEEDNVMISFPSKVIDNQISDIVKSEPSESKETYLENVREVNVKEEIKQEVEDEYQQVPPELLYPAQSFKQKKQVASKKAFNCQFCFKSFSDKRNLKRHERIHTGERPFQCDICAKRFVQKTDLNAHKRVHTGEKPFQCETCKKSFGDKKDLVKHERIHTGEKPYECNICGKTFRQLGHLNSHHKIHTGERNFACGVCGNQFTEKSSLTLHMKIHTGEKNFSCEFCEKSFMRKSHLDHHLLVHTGEKPHQCNMCEKSFARKEHLKRHTLVHTGDKPHKCGMCDKSFADKSTLNNHMKVHTEEELNQMDLYKLDNQIISEEDNVMVELSSKLTDDEISDIIRTLQPEQLLGQQEISSTTQHSSYICLHCWKSFLIESDFINHKTTCNKTSGRSDSEETEADDSENLTEFVDCEVMIKEEIKEEVD